MRSRAHLREWVVASVVVAILAAGLAVEVFGGPLGEPPPSAAEESLFVERAVFCHALGEGMKGAAHLTAGPAGDEPLLLDIQPGGEGPTELTNRVAIRSLREPSTAEVISYGGFAVASTAAALQAPVQGLGASPCINSAATKWYFAQGSSAPGFNEFLVLYNPFPDEAVVRVQLVTPQGIRSKANLADVPVPSGQTTVVRVNEFVLQENVLGAQIEAVRGRIVAWKTVFAKPDNRPPGVGSTVGAREPSEEWFFPSGAAGPEADERITVLNPSDEEAVVTVSLIGDEERLQPRKLIEVTIPRRGVKELSVTQAVGRDVGGVSAILRSQNGVPVIAERAVWYESSGFNGFSLSLGAPKASASWWLGSAAASPSRDAVILLNVGQEDAQVTVELLVPEGETAERVEISDVRVPAGGRARVALEGLVDGPAVAIVRSSTPVVAERIAYSAFTNDVASLTGIPIE